jgi:hypothetical protein
LIVPDSGSRGLHSVILTPFTSSRSASTALIRKPWVRAALPIVMP